MNCCIETSTGRALVCRLPCGADLLDQITSICEKEGIGFGRVEAIGAVQKARVGYYDQVAREYRYLEFDRNMEILSLLGNISIKDSKPMVHAHITLGDSEGAAVGGHLAPGTIVFATECTIQEFQGEAPVREYDGVTGLALWKM